MKAVPALTAEAPQPPTGASPIPSCDQDFPHENSTRHATGSGSTIPSHLRNITHSSSPLPPLTPTPARATTSCARLHRREEEPSLVPPLEPSLDASCKSSIHQKNDYAELFSFCGHHNNIPQNYHDGGNQGISNCYRSSTMTIEDDNSARRKKRHPLSATTATTSFASAAATNTIAPTTPPPPIHTTLSATPIPPSSSPPPRTTTITIPITFTYKDHIIRSSTTPPRNLSETTTRTTSPMPSSSNNNNHYNQAHRSINLNGVDGSSMGEGGAGAGATGGSSSKRLSISTQLQRSSTSRDAKSPTALAGLGGSSNSGSSVVRMNGNAAWLGHARSTLLAGGSGVSGQWKSNTVLLFSSSSSTSASSLTRKYETASKSIDHSANTPVQQQQPHLGTINGSGLQQQSGRQSQPSSSATATASATTIGSAFLQQDSNTTEMDTFLETHSGVIMAYPITSSSHQTNTTGNGPGSIGLGDFVRSLFSQSLVSRLHSHRSRFSSVSVGTSSCSVMRVFNTCYLLYLIPVTSITIAQLITVDMICNDQLYSWLTVQAFMFLSQIVSTCNILQRQTMMISSSRANAIDQRTRIMLLIFMIWTVVGVGFMGSENGNSQDPCSTTNDPIYSLSFKIIIFHVSMIGIYFLPCSSLLLTRVFPNSISSGLTRTATKPMIDKLGSTPMVEGMFGGDVEEATCAICLGDYKPDETIRFLPCQHHFHLECVDQWLATDKSCPLCKHDIDKPLDIHNSRRSAITHAISNTHTNSNASEDDTHHNHNSVGPSHNTNGNNAIGMDGFQVIIV